MYREKESELKMFCDRIDIKKIKKFTADRHCEFCVCGLFQDW